MLGEINMKKKFVNKNIILIYSLILLGLEIIMIYLIIKSILTKDLISPNEITFYEYLKVKLSNLI